jgi:GNAT superfamily N-acetyltransferase
MALDVRLATSADAGHIATLRRVWVEEQAGETIDDPAYDDAFADWFAREQHQRLTWLGYVDGTPVGMLNLLVFTRMPKPGRPVSRWGYLANFFLRAEHRDAGIGSRLLAACTEHADAEGFVRVVLSPSERSVPLYARAGFAPATSLMVRPGP